MSYSGPVQVKDILRVFFVGMALLAISNCQSTPQRESVAQNDETSIFKEVTSVGHNHSAFVHQDTVFFLSEKRPRHKGIELYRLQNQTSKRLTFQNSILIRPVVSNGQIWFGSTMYTQTEMPKRLRAFSPQPNEPRFDLLNTDLNGKNVQRTPLSRWIQGPLAISPKGDAIALAMKQDNFWRIQKVNLKTAKKEFLTAPNSNNAMPAWNPTKNSIAWVETVSSDSPMSKIHENAPSTGILAEMEGLVSDLIWHPQGEKLFFTWREDTSGPPIVASWNSESKCVESWVEFASGAKEPAIDQKAEWLYFTGMRSRSSQIYKVAMSDLNPECL